MIGNVRLHGLGEFERIGGHVLYIYRGDDPCVSWHACYNQAL